MVEKAEYIADKPQFVVNGFVRSSVIAALDCKEPEESSDY